ncbi:hypothetical protein ODJ79_16910 [Actinoplanes sp. KI2]|nr:hypothetical protein [Actinoplanes sp. KI2]MCU7725409.1 hypothetical protein [Actinoplanes sp. KI2]
MGLFVIVLMSIATVLLIRNMNKRLRRLPDSFPDEEQTQREAEIARLNADLERSGAEPVRPGSDQNRSSGDQVAAESEVKGDTTDSDKVVADGDQGRV